MGLDPGYRVAFLDWLACSRRGAQEPAARAARGAADGLAGRVAALGVAGHVLDFDDTYTPGLAHLSAPVAPAALALGAELGKSVGDVLFAYAAGFEAMASLSAANHPALRERGWHPTSVCGVVGSATAAARLLGLDANGTRTAQRLSLLGAAGLVGAFGSDGKSIQVGAAAAAGVQAARMAAAGATASNDVERGFEAAYGARWVEPDEGGDAIRENWIKAYPCCLQTHGAIDAALAAPDDVEGGEVIVHPISLTAATLGPDVATGLEAKFSIPYLVAYTLTRRAPTIASFAAVDPDARRLAALIHVRTDEALGESEARLLVGGELVSRVEAPIGSPGNPMSEERLADKVRSLAGDSLVGALDDLDRPARELLE